MEKITSFMRATKKTRPHEQRTSLSKKPAPAVDRPAPESTAVSAEASGSNGDSKQDHVPRFMYQTVKYAPQGQPRKVSPEMEAVAAYIQANYEVPRDFEQNLRFGPHSGLTFETRLARAYSLRLLSPKPPGRRQVHAVALKPICLTCATVGHSYKECPNGF